MSRAHVSLGSLVCACVLTLTASRTSAQTVEEYRARVARIAEVLEQVELKREEQERARNEQERARNQQLLSQLDTVRVGRLVVITTAHYVEMVEEAARREWPTIEPTVRIEAPGDVSEEYIFYLGLPHPPRPGIEELRCSRYLARRARERCPTCPACLGLGGSFQRAVGRLLARRLDPDSSFIRELPFEPLAREWRGGVYAELATADSRSARFCFLGELRSCRDLLGLSELSEPLAVWYSPEERRRLVSRLHPGLARDKWRSCVDEGADDACLGFLRDLGPGYSLTPLSTPADARRIVLDVALELGREGTYARISTAGGPSVEERLAVAAEVEPDTLIARWREAVLEAWPRTQMVSGLEGVAALAWIVGLAFLATRSSRWRSG